MSFSNVDVISTTMKENESSFMGEVNDEINIHSSSLGKKVSGTDNRDIFNLKEIPSQEDALRNINLTHSVTNINIKHAAQTGKGGFLSAIKNFFMGIFSNDLKIPKTVTVKVAGEEIEVDGERFRGMLEALPKGEREGVVGDLGKHISDRLKKGGDLLQSVLFGKQLPKASTQKISDLMLFIQLRHEALHPNESFTNGAYSIEDPEGHLADYLDSCKEGYDRSSSHLEGLQDASLGHGKRNAMRGIDIPGGVTTGLLDKRGTIHYGSIPQQEDVKGSTRRLFIQTERHGCRLSPRNFKFWTKSFWVNTSGRAHRAMQFSDIGRAICNVFKKSDEKPGNNYRSEKLPGLSPKDIAETFKDISLCERLEELKPYFSKNGTKRLPENARLSQTLEWLDEVENIVVDIFIPMPVKLGTGFLFRNNETIDKFKDALNSIKSKLIHGMYTDNPNQKDRNLDKSFSWFLTSTGLKHIDRLGNEVMMSLSDLQIQKEGIHLAKNIEDVDVAFSSQNEEISPLNHATENSNENNNDELEFYSF